MKSFFRSRIWNARELLFILLMAVAMDRLALAHSDQPEKALEKTVASASGPAAVSSLYPSQLLLSSCKDGGDAGQISK